jgi:Fe-S-cluster containining protein
VDSFDDQITAECRRCGTCCKKGGPALHVEDKQILESGNILLDCLYTIRKGELARDNVNDSLIRLEAEIIKIKSRPGSSECMFFNDTDMSCGIYAHRPLECRILECWNTAKIKSMYSQTRLTRTLVLEKAEWLQDLVQTHESECDIDKIQRLVNDREAGDADAASALTEKINYDFHLRRVVTEKGNIAPDMLDFLLCRPLNEIVSRQFKIKIQKSKSE